jgi:hypothetical protein
VKPTNVLVTLHDGKPVPKVIDFGVAKATNQRLSDRTIYTRFAQIIGTPMYMSPEQAELSGLDVDTRSDIYSLGVLLYELIAGTTPFDKQRLEQAAYDEIRRIIREEEPPKPSTRISTLGERATAVASHRGTDVQSLSRFVVGDLDMIVMKALEKDRTRRYDTATALADDVQHFLNSEAITARSPSLAYRFAKFARRNRVAMVTSVLVLCSLIFGILAATWMAVQVSGKNLELADAIARLKDEERQTAQTLVKLAQSEYEQAVAAALAGDEETSRTALAVLKEARVCAYESNVVEGVINLIGGNYHEASRFARQALLETPVQGSCQKTAAHALLYSASWRLENDDRVWRGSGRLRTLIPETDTDHLLLAHALVIYDPRHSLRLLNARPRLVRSAIGLLTRGMLRVYIAVDDQDRQLIDKAIQDLECSQLLLVRNQVSEAWCIAAYAVALEIALSERRSEDAARYTEKGRPLAATPAANDPFSHQVRYAFFRAAGEPELASDAIRQVGRYPGRLNILFAAHLLQEHDYAAAAREFDNTVPPQCKQDRAVQVGEAHLVRGIDGGADRTRKLAKGLLNNRTPLYPLLGLCTLCLVADVNEINAFAHKLGNDIERAPDSYSELMGVEACADLLAGEDEAECLRRAGDGAYARAQVYFTVGMLRLAERNRDEAHKYFRQSVATGAIGSIGYELARAYKARMDADGTWPKWANPSNAD